MRLRETLSDFIVISNFVREWYWVEQNLCISFTMWSEPYERYCDSLAWDIIIWL